ncbi:UNC93-like protein MFSD11 [Diabrotica virgifera virgifera]|uniref:UNC93-like protein MFSD11 n=1 Tax=Diabrotica virgifera virgifera TaxID=50390 RepID=A0ABM5KFG7_DIAVI|nr:UNC93-like protein MFSD11 [Diabrotica virgifera virgifera]
MDPSLRNIILLSIGFLLLLTGSFTMTNIQKTIIDSIQKDDPTFTENGYYSQAINGGFSAVFNWIVPSVINAFGTKMAMVLGALLSILFILQFMLQKVWILYTSCGVYGLGLALIWVAQGDYLTFLSTETTISKNTGIFIIITSLNMIFGNIFVMVGFNGKEKINKETRTLVLSTLAVLCTAALIVFVFLPKHKKEEKSSGTKAVGVLESLIKPVKLCFTKNMLLLIVTFLYNGLELGFFSGIYASCIGFTRELPNRKLLVGLSGIFVGIGEIFAGSLISIFPKKVAELGRSVLIGVGCFVHSLSFILIFINLPDNSPFGDTDEPAIIQSNTVLAMFCSFLLGMGDCIIANVITSLLGTVYSEEAPSAFAIFQFFVAVGAVINFVTAELLGLYYKLAMLFGLGILSTVFFIIVDTSCKRKLLGNKDKIETS